MSGPTRVTLTAPGRARPLTDVRPDVSVGKPAMLEARWLVLAYAPLPGAWGSPLELRTSKPTARRSSSAAEASVKMYSVPKGA